MSWAGFLHSKRLFRIGVFLVFAVALYFRTAGLSHDLDLGNVYHPDTPKQIRATERFLQGEYFTRIGGRDYDGYPLFNSHLVEYAVRSYVWLAEPLYRHLGLMSAPPLPSMSQLFGLTRAINAMLSALTACLVFVMGYRFFHPAAGWIAGACMAVSPADVTAAHYATGDVTAAFFSGLAMWMALSISRSKNRGYYALAGLFTAAAFSTKYHGVIASMAVATAHVTQFGPGLRFFSRDSWLRGLLFISSLLLGIFLTSPALLVNTQAAYKDIVTFLEYTASFGMTPEMAVAPIHQRFAMGMSLNLPVLLDVVGAVPAMAVLLVLFSRKPRQPIWIIASVPLTYIVLGLATKPLTHPVYHTLATPGIFLLAGVGIWQVAAYASRKPAQILIASLLLGIGLWHLIPYSLREVFFYRHNDTRYLAEHWVRTHLPTSFNVYTSLYTSPPRVHKQPLAGPQGQAYLYSPRVVIQPPANTFEAFRIRLETDKLSIFRNWDQLLFIQASDIISPHSKRPGFQPIAASDPVNVLLEATPWWIQREASWDLTAGMQRRGIKQTAEPVSHAAWLLRTGDAPADIELSFGGRKQRQQLRAFDTRLVWIDDARPKKLKRVPDHFYSWQVSSRYGYARVHLLTDPHELLWAAFHIQDYSAMESLLNDLAPAALTVGDRLLQSLLTARHAPSTEITRPHAQDTLTDLHQSYGLSKVFWDALPLQEIKLQPRQIDATSSIQYESSLQLLEPGSYLLELEWPTRHASLQVQIFDTAANQSITAKQIDPPETQAVIPFIIGPQMPAIHVVVSGDRDISTDGLAVRIRPNPWATLLEYQAIYRAIVDDQFAGVEFSALAYSVLLDRSRFLQKNGHYERALEAAMAAAQSAPYRAQAYELITRLMELDPMTEVELPETVLAGLATYQHSYLQNRIRAADVRMRNGMHLQGYRINGERFNPGDTLELALYWKTPRLFHRLGRHAAWIHIYQEESRHERLNGDQSLLSFLSLSQDLDLLHPQMVSIPLPADMQPGRYQIETGLWIPAEHRRIRVQRAGIEQSRRGVYLMPIDIQ